MAAVAMSGGYRQAGWHMGWEGREGREGGREFLST